MAKKRNPEPAGAGTGTAIDPQGPTIPTVDETITNGSGGADARKVVPTIPPAKTSDGPDGLAEPSKNPQRTAKPAATAAVSAENIDPLIREHGALFFVTKKIAQANQMAFAAKFTNDRQVRFEQETGSFVRYDDASGIWELVSEPEVKRDLAKFVKEQAEKHNAKAFLPNRTNGFLRAIVALMKGFTLAVDKDRLHRVTHVGNGMLDLSVSPGELRPFDPSYGSLRRCVVNYQPKAECPRFLTSLLKPALPDYDIDLLQRFAGAVLLGENTAQRFMILYGGAARGKSTLVTVLERIIGLNNVAHLRTEHLPGRFETHGFLNKTLLTAKDVPGDFLSRRGAQMLKALVGDDLIEAEMKYGGKFRLRGNFNVVVTSNNRLRLAMEEDEAAWRRRLMVLRVAGPAPEKRIANFADVLVREEGEGILRWIVEGAVKHLEELDAAGDFKLTEPQHNRVNDLLQESKSATVYVERQVVEQRSKDVTVDELKLAYLDFCRTKGWEAFSVRQFENALNDLMQKFHGALRRNDITRGEKTVRGFKHVALKTEAVK